MIIAYQLDNMFMLVTAKEGTCVKDLRDGEHSNATIYHNGKKADDNAVLRDADFVHVQTVAYNKDEPLGLIKYCGEGRV